MNIKQLRALNIELLHANLEMLRETKEYCRRNGLPSPVSDDSLSYRVQQLSDLCDAINENPLKRRQSGTPEEITHDATAAQITQRRNIT